MEERIPAERTVGLFSKDAVGLGDRSWTWSDWHSLVRSCMVLQKRACPRTACARRNEGPQQSAMLSVDVFLWYLDLYL